MLLYMNNVLILKVLFGAYCSSKIGVYSWRAFVVQLTDDGLRETRANKRVREKRYDHSFIVLAPVAQLEERESSKL